MGDLFVDLYSTYDERAWENLYDDLSSHARNCSSHFADCDLHECIPRSRETHTRSSKRGLQLYGE